MRIGSLLRRTVLVPALAALLVAAVAVGLWIEMSSSHADGSPRIEAAASAGTTIPAGRVFLIDCQHHAQVRPRHFDIACGGDNATLKHIRWTSWNRTSAHATATFSINTCTPDCASAHYRDYPVRLRADHVADGDGTGRFRHLRLTFPKAAPPEVHGHTSSIDLDALRGN